MAITNNPALRENAAPAPATQTAPQTAGTAAPKAKATTGGKAGGKSEAFRNTGREILANMSEDEKAAMGSKSNAIAFVTALGDPRQKQDRVQGNATVPSWLVVGFRFKAVEPVTIIRKPFNNPPKDILDVDHSSMVTETIPAGQTFDLNLTETARLLAQHVYGGAATGGEKGVFLTYKESQTRKDPLPVLACIGKGSVKEGMILIADKVGENEYKVKPEFQAFAPLYTKKNAVKKGSSAAKEQTTARHEVSAAFLAFLMKKENDASASQPAAQ